MLLSFFIKKSKIKKPSRHKPRKTASRVLYEKHKEQARILVHKKLEHWSTVYSLEYNRVSIRDQKTRWGSCSSLGNLNFNYRLVFLPEHLVDYIVVHELCHLQHMHHRKTFWDMVEQTIPNYKNCIAELQIYSKALSQNKIHPLSTEIM